MKPSILATSDFVTKLHTVLQNGNKMMRFVLIVAVLLVSHAFAQHADAAAGPGDRFRNAARTLLAEGRTELAAGDFQAALRLLESALVADPGNVETMIAIGEAHEAMDRRKIALGYYRRALVIEPTSRRALLAESLALIHDNTPDKAEANLERLRRLCGEGPCEEADRIARALTDHKSAKGRDG